jgi:hypothetical protein
MKRYKTLFALLFLCCNAHAQLYKCVISGKPTFSERPCAPDAKIIATGDGSISFERQMQAADVARREQRLAQTMIYPESADRGERQRSSQPSQTSAKDQKQAKCDSLLKAARSAKNEAATYRYHQGLIDDAKRRQKEAEDAHFSECYGSNTVPYSPPQ